MLKFVGRSVSQCLFFSVACDGHGFCAYRCSSLAMRWICAYGLQRLARSRFANQGFAHQRAIVLVARIWCPRTWVCFCFVRRAHVEARRRRRKAFRWRGLGGALRVRMGGRLWPWWPCVFCWAYDGVADSSSRGQLALASGWLRTIANAFVAAALHVRPCVVRNAVGVESSPRSQAIAALVSGMHLCVRRRTLATNAPPTVSYFFSEGVDFNTLQPRDLGDAQSEFFWPRDGRRIERGVPSAAATTTGALARIGSRFFAAGAQHTCIHIPFFPPISPTLENLHPGVTRW